MKKEKSINISGIRFYLVCIFFYFQNNFSHNFLSGHFFHNSKISVIFSVLLIDSRQKLVCPSSLKACHINFKNRFEFATLLKTDYVSKIFHIVILETNKSKMTENFVALNNKLLVYYTFSWICILKRETPSKHMLNAAKLEYCNTRFFYKQHQAGIGKK